MGGGSRRHHCRGVRVKVNIYNMALHTLRLSVAVTRWSRSAQLLYIEPVSSGMGDCLWASKLSHYVISHPGQLSLAIPPWVGAMSTGDGYNHR